MPCAQSAGRASCSGTASAATAGNSRGETAAMASSSSAPVMPYCAASSSGSAAAIAGGSTSARCAAVNASSSRAPTPSAKRTCHGASGAACTGTVSSTRPARSHPGTGPSARHVPGRSHAAHSHASGFSPRPRWRSSSALRRSTL